MKKKIVELLKYAHVKVFLLITVMIIPFNLFMVIQQNRMRDGLMEQSKLMLQNLLNNCINEISVRMENCHELLNWYVTDDEHCIRMARSKEEDIKYQIERIYLYYSLEQFGITTYGADGYFFYFEDVDDTVVFCEDTSEEDLRRYIWHDLGGDVKNVFERGWSLYEYNGTEYLMLQVDYIGVTYGGWINLDKIENNLENTIEIKDYSLSFEEQKSEQVSDRCIYLTADNGKIFLNLTMEEDVILGTVSKSQMVGYMIVFLMFLLSPMIYVILRQMLLQPLFVLQTSHQRLQIDSHWRITQQAKSTEYKILYESFNDLADNLNRLKIEQYEREIEKRKMEQRNQRLQMHPHFLLNTFNLMYKLLQRREIEAVQDMLLYLADYFRYIFRDNRELELFFKERKLIDAFVRITRIRFQRNVVLEYNLDPEIDLVRIPPLLIHNFVENCVKHGLRTDRDLHITINGTYEKKRVIFEVIDDGNGMDEKTLIWQRKILSGEKEPENPNEHVGLLNSMKRLKFYYGDEAVIEMDTVPGEMMCFTIGFPYNLESENESVDCE